MEYLRSLPSHAPLRRIPGMDTLLINRREEIAKLHGMIDRISSQISCGILPSKQYFARSVLVSNELF